MRRWIIYLGEPQESVDRENGRETAMNVPLLEIANLHDEGCGVAPSILKRNNADYYLGYFEKSLLNFYKTLDKNILSPIIIFLALLK